MGYLKKRALSSVISTVLLSAAVLVIGGMIWNYANGASSVIAYDYHEDSMELINQIEERVMFEHITNNSTHLTIYLYNYGEVDVEVDVYANTSSTDLQNPMTIESKESECAVIPLACSSGDIIGLSVYTRRQNIVYYSYIAK